MITEIKYDANRLENSNDEELAKLIYDKACELHCETFGQNFEIANPALKEIYGTWVLENEVNNGGFDQFFYNNGIEMAEFAKSGFRRIGADQIAELVDKSLQIYRDQSVEYANKRNPNLNELDDVFYAYEGLEDLRLTYIKANYQEFVVRKK